MPFEFQKLKIPGLILVKPKIFTDARGFFMEIYKKSDFEKAGIKVNFVQDNHSRSTKNVLRGLHYQKPPYEQAKLVRCIKGKIFDVAVDIRKNSSTYTKWVGVELSEENSYMFYIPEGFAHGFLVLSDEAEIIYKCSCEYKPEYDSGIKYNDPVININWPVSNPILSPKDFNLPTLGVGRSKDLYKEGLL